MEKVLDLKKTVAELVKEFPEFQQAMAEIGFKEILNPIALEVMGRVMTLPKGAAVKGIPLETVLAGLKARGFSIKEEAPATEESAAAGREEALRNLLRRLSAGESLASVREDFVRDFASVSAEEIAAAEQKLIQEGTPLHEVQRLCDVHSALFHGVASEPPPGALSHDEIHAQAASVNPDDIDALPEAHPLTILRAENAALETLLDTIEAELDGAKRTDVMFQHILALGDVRSHYIKKEELLMPLLYDYGVTGPSQVMWGIDDEMKRELAMIIKALKADAETLPLYEARIRALTQRVREMIFKEEKILFPLSLRYFTQMEWYRCYHDLPDMGISFGVPIPAWAEAQPWLDQEEARLAHGVELAQKRTRLEHHISQCKAHEARFTQEIAQLTEQCEMLRTDGREHEERLHELDIALAALSTEIETRARHRASREFERAEAEKALKDIVEQSAQLTNGLQKDEVRLSELEGKISRQDATFQEKEHQSAVLKDQRLAHEAESRVLDAAIKSAIARVENIRTKQHDCDKALERIHIRLEDCRATLLSDFGVTPEMAAADAQDADPHFLKERLQALERSIQELGSINPNAVEEYAEKKARYEEEEEQIEDLRAAKQDIEQIIQKIDQDMTRTFRDAFHQIQEYFNEIFVRLFCGGIAELRLTDKEDILSSGVEILVTLPDKKRQNLSALSGGERALTVIALLFSFLRYRPSPFSILDEIDAPLDEANVSRFGEFLREFAKDTQFIVVTHRKGTMRAADTMYGVTVEDAGVSKVLSIRMKDYETVQTA